jgi:crotonobetainyl-CoA:carnitine CoA-transferase CaiB-like acyl-CoA transferase
LVLDPAMPLALSRFRMLDLSRQLPGPFCSMLLADLGMDVVTIYSPTDPMGMGVPLLGRNKRSLTLNLKQPEAREIFHRLAKDADVVLEGGRPGGAAKLGVDYETLAKLNERIVYCSISGYGQDGPYRNRVGHDVNYLGFAGVIGTTGVAGVAPAIPGVQIADIGGGALMAAVGILTALLAREATGKGQFVDIGMMDGSVAWQVINTFNFLSQGAQPSWGEALLTGRHPCYALYETKDGRWVTVGALEPHFWGNLCNRLGMPDLIGEQFSEGEKRDAMFRRVRAKFKEKTQAEWVAELADLDICFGPVATLSEALDDPHVKHRQMVVEQDDGRGNRRRTLGNPVKLSDTPPTLRTPPPSLGEHTDAVLAGLGYSKADVARLRERGIV